MEKKNWMSGYGTFFVAELAEKQNFKRQEINRSKGLLDSLQYLVGCMYLSDLHMSVNAPLIAKNLCKIEPDSYSLSEWMDAVSYITGQDIYIREKNDAVKYIKRYTEAVSRDKAEYIIQ